MSKKLYPSDISDKQFARILPLLESVRKKTRPRKLSLHLIFMRFCMFWRQVANGNLYQKIIQTTGMFIIILQIGETLEFLMKF